MDKCSPTISILFFSLLCSFVGLDWISLPHTLNFLRVTLGSALPVLFLSWAKDSITWPWRMSSLSPCPKQSAKLCMKTQQCRWSQLFKNINFSHTHTHRFPFSNSSSLKSPLPSITQFYTDSSAGLGLCLPSCMGCLQWVVSDFFFPPNRIRSNLEKKGWG